MSPKTLYQLVVVLIFLVPCSVSGQISQGGIPIQINKLKSATPDADLVVMPTVDNQKLRALYSRAEPDMLKPLHFAKAFPVSLTPENSGKWYSDGEFNIWQLRIRSTDAYSLNLILKHFKLPEGGRLYLISQTSGEIKGAYTSVNNSASQVLAIEPVEGDELMVQYEEPVKVSFKGDFIIAQVAHDFMGVGSSGAHRPLGLSGACNVNVNCDLANGSEDIRDGVCRILVEGSELCTATLINNTSFDGTPYALTAYHCINTEVQAQATVFLFNYESPYCSSIDGDVSRSLSGSSLKASFDSLDFALVRLNTVPPPYYRPFLVGWNSQNIAATNSLSIHHPLGDIKKVSIDRDSPQTNSFNSTYKTNGFWKIIRWEYGVTEAGSSGGPLFDQNHQLVGSLTGGSANCSSPTNDFFEKFALAWNYRKESSKQLKFWLDPLNSNLQKLAGMFMYPDKNLCRPTTNFLDADTYTALQISNGLTKKGYYTGSNSAGYTDFAEQYKFSKNCVVQGITLGIAKVKINPNYANSYLNVQVYEGALQPEILLYEEKFDIRTFWPDGMNYLTFTTPVKTTGTFYVSYNILQLNPGDTLAVYMAARKNSTNSFYLKNQNGWQTYNSQNLNGYGSALLTELIACNIDDPLSAEIFKSDWPGVKVFPNPLNGSTLLTVQAEKNFDCPEDVSVYDLLGKKQDIPIIQEGDSILKLNFSGKRPGIYLVHLNTQGHSVVAKVAYVP